MRLVSWNIRAPGDPDNPRERPLPRARQGRLRPPFQRAPRAQGARTVRAVPPPPPADGRTHTPAFIRAAGSSWSWWSAGPASPPSTGRPRARRSRPSGTRRPPGWLVAPRGRSSCWGDFNAGASGVDAEAYRFKAGRAFAKLAGIGLVDLWRREHGDTREHTWFSHPGRGRPGRGFRIDHAFASPRLADRVTSCRYDHEVRTGGGSDHSLLIVELAPKSPAVRSLAFSTGKR